MANPSVKARDFTTALRAAGCRVRQAKGSHEVWYCGCGRHTITVTTGHGTIAPQVLRDVTKHLACVALSF